jgi:hypothetical protein
VFKKTLIALSVGAALGSVNANAVTFDFTPNAWTTEGAELVNNFVVPDINVTLGAEYSKDDVITFEFNADVTGAFNPTIDVTLAAGNDGTMTLGYVSATDSTVTYRVTELSSASSDSISTVGATFTLTSAAGSSNLVVGDQVRAAGGLTATYSAVTGLSSLALDSTPAAIVDKNGTAATTDDESQLVTFKTQYATVKATTKMNGVIDVNASPERTLFVGGGATDEATISVTEATATHDALTTGLVLTLSGNFSFLQDTDATKAGVQQASGVIYADLNSDADRVQGVVNANADAVTFTWATDVLGDVGVFFDNAPNLTQVSKTVTSATVMERGEFTAAVDVKYAPVKPKYADSDTTAAPAAGDYDTTAVTGDVTSKAAGSVAAGEWTLNGANITVYSMPINNAAVTNYLYVTNTGSQAAEVSVVATLADGTKITADDIATVGKSSITNITSAVEAALASADGNRATVELTFNAPACNIVVSAAYNVMGDRLPLETSQTLDGKCP